MKNFISEYFGISEKQAKGTVAVFMIAIPLAFMPIAFNWYKQKSYQQVSYTNEVASLPDFKQKPVAANTERPFEAEDSKAFTASYTAKPQTGYKKYDKTEGISKPFSFDPNTIDDAGWKQLGLSDYSINSLRNYQAKGGRFYHSDGIKKIYGISSELAEKIIPYVSIPTQQQNYKDHAADSYAVTENKSYARPEVKPIDINTADSLQWQSLPGIGPGYARRIVNFREKLGGFLSIDQVAETYGLPDSTFRQVKKYLTNNVGPNKNLLVNKYDYKNLKHPYLSYAQAKAIVAYREQHGMFKSVLDLQKVMVIDEDTYAKISPYVSLD